MPARKCGDCGGTGKVGDGRCHACRGNGLIITPSIPAPDPDAVRSVLEAVKIIPMRPGDVVVCKVPSFIDDATIERIRADLSEVFEGHQIVVLSGGMDIEVIRREDDNVA
jgi:hypothetical protein